MGEANDKRAMIDHIIKTASPKDQGYAAGRVAWRHGPRILSHGGGKLADEIIEKFPEEVAAELIAIQKRRKEQEK